MIFKSLANAYPGYARKLIPIVAEYGRFDDLLPLLETNLKQEVADYLIDTMISDYKLMQENKPISLLAKWLPSINASNEQTKRYAKTLIVYLQKRDIFIN